MINVPIVCVYLSWMWEKFPLYEYTYVVNFVKEHKGRHRSKTVEQMQSGISKL